ncbi:hypothetical protein D3C71_1865650 [compost metagenome]
MVFRIHRTGETNRSAIDIDLATRRLMIAGKDLHQRGFAGAVLTDDRMNLAGANGQRNILQDLDDPERLRQAACIKQRRTYG